MLSRNSNLSLVSCAIIALVSVGCRGTRPMDSAFKITKHQNPDAADVDAPRQRLATASSRASSSRTGSSMKSRSSEDTKGIAQVSHQEESVVRQSRPTAEQRRLADRRRSNTTYARPESPKYQRKTYDDRDPGARVARSVEDPGSKYLSSKQATRSKSDSAQRRIDHDGVAKSDQSSLTSKSAGIQSTTSRQSLSSHSSGKSRPGPKSPESQSDLSDSQLLEAFANTSPEVKEQALRQLVAVLSSEAETTSQPESLSQSLKKSVNRNHALPELTHKKSTEPVNRLAASSDSKEKEAENSNSKTRLQETVVENLAVEKRYAKKPVDDAVEPVSASSAELDVPMVKTAVGQQSLEASATPSPESLSDETLYKMLLARLSSPTADESEADRARRLIAARHLMVLSGDPDKAVEQLEGMTEKEQEYLRHQLLGLWTMVDPDGHPVASRRFSSALPQIREATKYLAAATDSLEVRSLAFCTEILSYGQIKPFEGNRFKPGQQVILYCEVENFIAKNVDGGYQTHLQGSYDVLNADNEKVASQLLPADQQVSSNYLRDYFIAYQMHLPQELEPGTYRLKLTMEDVEGKKYGQSSIPFVIAK